MEPGEPNVRLDINNLPNPWTKKQYYFALYYLANPNAAEAATKAGYSKQSAKEMGYENLTKPHISKFLSDRTKKIVTELEVTPERIMKEVAIIAFSNMMDYITIDNKGRAFIDLNRMTREQAAAIALIETTEMPPFKTMENGEEVVREVIKNKIKLQDKMDALGKLMLRYNLVHPIEVNVNHSDEAKYDIQEVARRMAFILAKAAPSSKNSLIIEQAVAKDGK